MSDQSLSDAAHRDPSRNIAARLARLAESWIDGTGRRWDRLEQMEQLVDSLRRTYAQELERREAPEPVGVGMSDRYAAVLTPSCAHCLAYFPFGEDHVCAARAATNDLPARTNNVGCRVVDRLDLDRLPGGLVRVDCVTCGGWYAEGADAKDMPCKGKPVGLGAAPWLADRAP